METCFRGHRRPDAHLSAGRECRESTSRELDRIEGLANAARRVMVVAEAESGQGKCSTARGGAGLFQRNSSEQATSVLRLFA